MKAHVRESETPHGRALGAKARETLPPEVPPGPPRSTYSLALSLLSELAPSERLALVRTVLGEVVGVQEHAAECGRYAARAVVRNRGAIAEVLDGPAGLVSTWLEEADANESAVTSIEAAIRRTLGGPLAGPQDTEDASHLLRTMSEYRGVAMALRACADEVRAVAAAIQLETEPGQSGGAL
ncbi:MAG: hypothetical protein SangKO_032000 [Sandaracinaceae bacterium]